MTSLYFTCNQELNELSGLWRMEWTTLEDKGFEGLPYLRKAPDSIAKQVVPL